MTEPTKEIGVVHPEAQKSWKTFVDSGVVELVAAYNLCNGVYALVDCGMAARLAGDDLVPLSRATEGFEPRLAAELLRYLAIHDVIETRGDSVRLTARGRLLTSDIAFAHLGFYLKAYGGIAANISSLVQRKMQYGRDTSRNSEELARHGSVLTHDWVNQAGIDAIIGLEGKCVLDIGTGAGTFLIDVCRRDPSIRAIGLDNSPEAVEFGRKRVAKEGLSDRLQFVVADGFAPETWPDVCKQADVWYAFGMVHEHFRGGEEAVVKLLDRFASIMRQNGVKSFVLGEPELFSSKNDSDFLLAHIFTAQGYPRPRTEWLKLFPRTTLRCHAVYSEQNITSAFFDLRTQ